MIPINYFDCINELMVKNKSAFSVRWLGVFTTVKNLVERRLFSPYEEINFIGEIEIKGRKKIQIRCCNRDNRLCRQRKLLCSFDRIQPSKFDYLVCVCFDRYNNVHGHYIFSKEEVQKFFPNMIDKNQNVVSNYKGLYIPLNEDIDEPLKTLLDSNFENWEKIKQ